MNKEKCFYNHTKIFGPPNIFSGTISHTPRGNILHSVHRPNNTILKNTEVTGFVAIGLGLVWNGSTLAH